jgi:hypothetical protein
MKLNSGNVYSTISAQLYKEFANHALIDIVNTLISNSGIEVYIAGGAIRNILNGIPIKDIDMFINGNPELTESIIKNVFKSGILEKGPFGAYRWYPHKHSEFYVDLVRFDQFVVAGHEIKTIQELLGNFDITINAIAIDIKNKLIIDPYNGITDITNGIIKALHLSFPEMYVSKEIQLSTLSVFWFRLLHYKTLFDYQFSPETNIWVKENKWRITDLDLFTKYFFKPLLPKELKLND